MLNNIRVVLVRTFHAGNIGSAARSMKTMGLSDLCLVTPRDFPSEQTRKMAAGAEDLLTNARTVTTLSDAISDCTVVIASTVRPRGYDLPELTPAQAAKMLVRAATSKPVALIFGPERMGLHNDDIRHAKYRVTISANPIYNSLNIAAAVQILSYEIYQAYLRETDHPPDTSLPYRELPSSADVERLYDHLTIALRKVGFLRSHQGETMNRIRRLISRAQPDIAETRLLRGVCRSIEKSLANQSIGKKKRE